MNKYCCDAIQFIKFAVVGVSNTLVCLTIYYASMIIGLHYLKANAIGFVVGAINSYYWNNKYVFKKASAGHLKPFAKLLICSSAMLLISQVIIFILVECLGFSEYIAPILSSTIIAIINFIICKLFVFK